MLAREGDAVDSVDKPARGRERDGERASGSAALRMESDVMADEASTLAPTLLVAMPQLQDPNFHHSVVLLCEHREDGAMGLVVNRVTDTRAADIVRLDPPVLHPSEVPVWIGGPVDPSRGWLLLREETADGVEIVPGLHLSASEQSLRAVLEGVTPAERCRFLVGYAGWGPKQLDSELAASAWLTVPVDLQLLFDVPTDQMWELAIRRLGIDPKDLAMGPGVH